MAKQWFYTIVDINRSIICFLLFFISPCLLFSEGYTIPERSEDNLIIGSYNIKWFGQQDHDLEKLARVISYFDICGILEVKDEREIPLLVEELNTFTEKEWNFTFGFKTKRPQGSYYESYAVVWRTDRASLGNGIISNIWDPSEAYRNDPFVISFRKDSFDCMLLLIHTRWGTDDEGSRENEVISLSEQISMIHDVTDERDIILAGDFNYSGNSQVMKSMAETLAFYQIDPNLKSTFKNDYSDYSSAYDHIYISADNTTEFLDGQSGVIDTTVLIYGDNSAESMRRSKIELSDHLPVWAVFYTGGEDDD